MSLILLVHLSGQTHSDLAVACLHGDIWKKKLLTGDHHLFSVFTAPANSTPCGSRFCESFAGRRGGGDWNLSRLEFQRGTETHRGTLHPRPRRDSLSAVPRPEWVCFRRSGGCKHGVNIQRVKHPLWQCTTSVWHVFALVACDSAWPHPPLPFYISICPHSPLCFFLMRSWSLASNPRLAKSQTARCNTAGNQHRET